MFQKVQTADVSKDPTSKPTSFVDSEVVVIRITQDGDGYEPRLLDVPPNRNIRLIIE